METYVYIEDYKENPEDRKYDRYITKSIDGIDEKDIHKIIYFSNDDIYLVYTNVTLDMVCYKKNKQWSKRNDS